MRTAVVTGGGSGLGRAFCLEMARSGAAVLVADIRADRAAAVADEVGTAGGTGHALTVDVADQAAVEHMATEADRLLGTTDLLVNNAGVAVGGPVGQVPLDDWHWILDINLRAVVHGCHAFVPRMKAAGNGAIVNVASAAGLISMPEMAPYNATKAAVVALSESLYGEVRQYGVNVTVLCPTFVKTNLLETARTTDSSALTAGTLAMERSRTSAEVVAKRALAAVRAGRPYCVPMLDGRLLWLLWRLFPGMVTRLMASPRLQDAVRRRAGAQPGAAARKGAA